MPQNYIGGYSREEGRAFQYEIEDSLQRDLGDEDGGHGNEETTQTEAANLGSVNILKRNLFQQDTVLLSTYFSRMIFNFFSSFSTLFSPDPRPNLSRTLPRIPHGIS